MSHRWRLLLVTAVVKWVLDVNCVVALRSTGPELRVFTRILGRLSQKTNIGDMETEAGTKPRSMPRPYVGYIALAVRNEVFPRNE